jgi:hypothetical protein
LNGRGRGRGRGTGGTRRSTRRRVVDSSNSDSDFE